MSYFSWAFHAMIKLYKAVSNTAWLIYAKGKISVVLRDPVSHGYYHKYAGLDGSSKYDNKEEVDQTWMQRVQLLLSEYK